MGRGMPPCRRSEKPFSVNEKAWGITHLDYIIEEDIPLFGAKAVTIAHLFRTGFPVPMGFCIPTGAYRSHLESIELFARIANVLASSGTHDSVVTQEWLASVRSQVEAIRLDPSLVREIGLAYEAIGGGLVAVRSSATAEDLASCSFAGQHETVFARDFDECIAAIPRVWASLWSDRAFGYRSRAGIDHLAIDMAIVVQCTVEADISGVAFSADPLGGRERVFIVEACRGLGGSLVSGHVQPDRYIVSRDEPSDVTHEPGTQHEELIVVDGQVTARSVALPDVVEPLLAEDQYHTICEYVFEIEGMLGCPVDIEWSYADEKLWILQARPITTLPTNRNTTAQRIAIYTDSDQTIWSNVNTGEILPGVITPMTWTIIANNAQHIFDGLFGMLGIRIDARELIGLVAGRVYFNLTLIRDSFLHIPTAGALDVDQMLGGMHAHVDLPPTRNDTSEKDASGWWGLIRAIPRVLLWTWRHSPKRAEGFCAQIRQVSDEVAVSLSGEPTERETAEIVNDLVGMFPRASDSISYAGVGMVGYTYLVWATRRWLGDESGALANRLVAGVGGVRSADAGLSLWRIADFVRRHEHVEAAIRSGEPWETIRDTFERLSSQDDVAAASFCTRWDVFMREHGHHTRGELEFANARWRERPEYILGLIRGYLDTADGNNPLRAYDVRAEAARQLADECRVQLRNPVKRRIFDYVLRRGRESAILRENVKNEAVRWLATVRTALLALGAHLAARDVFEEPDDIFFLEWDELDAVRLGTADFDVVSLIAERRAAHERYSTLTPPPVVVGEWDESDVSWTVTSDAETLKGLAVSAGVATGPARVLATVDADEPVRPGEILVAPFTDPGWTPYFVPAAGIVMDMGGLLSHGSIIAREYGIPAVVNVGPATSIIRTGDIITIDADRGEVRIEQRIEDKSLSSQRRIA